ncbi:MAG: hypothetical protein GY772_16590 [bacterium]|nr:hypothetical protein [bacterium]
MPATGSAGAIDTLVLPGLSTSVTPTADPPGILDYQTQIGYTPDVQPLNATCFGVFATGSGLTSLPYRRALAPYCPDFVSEQINAILPGSDPTDNRIRPLGVVEETKLGSTRAQYVVQPVEASDPPDPNETPVEGCCYYEVALDWTSPGLRVETELAISEVDANWVSKAIASVRDSLTRTLWITAGFGDAAGSEANPLAPDASGFGIPNSLYNSASLNPAFTTNPTPDTAWEPMYGNFVTYVGDPAFGGGGGVIEPSEAPNPASEAPVGLAPQFVPHASIVLKIKSVRQKITETTVTGTPSGNSRISTVMELAPVVRVIVPSVRAGTALTVPTALPRTGLRAASGDAGLQPPCINVQVWQKNSSATDGTTTPVYDLGVNWNALGDQV